MKWFPGSINEAVKTSKSRKAVFVVFVAGDDEISRDLVKVIDTPEISNSLEKEDFVAIRLESGSESYTFFSQIYRLVPVPSIFFIGEQGKPLEIVAGNITATDLKTKINTILTKVGKGIQDPSSSLIQAEQSSVNAAQSSESHKDVVGTAKAIETPSVSAEQSPTAEISGNVNIPELSKEEKVERARKLMELQKQQKMEKEKEEEKRREIERRDMGKQVQNARRRQQEVELAIAHEERMKEKAAENEARERVRQQIAQDKLERKHKEMDLLKQTTQNQQDQVRPQPPAAAFVGDGVARIQFKLPSGNPHMGKFEANSTLRELRAYVMNNIELPFQHFSLSTSFPRRDLTLEDDEKTLMDLELVPTAVILILPIKNSSPPTTVVGARDDGFLSRFMWALFAPIITVYSYIVGYFTGASARGTDNQSNDSSAAGESTSSGARANSMPSSGAIRRNLGGPSTTVRARGNIHRLHSGGDDNDENNTWNGNSTQQM